MGKRSSKSKSPARPQDQSKAVYNRLGPTNSRTLGSTLNHDRPAIPSSTFRTLEQSITKDSLRTHERYEWNPKKGESRIVHEPADLLAHAQSHINKGKFHTVTSGARQRYQREEGPPEDGHMMSGMSMATPSLGGSMKTRNRDHKDRY